MNIQRVFQGKRFAGMMLAGAMAAGIAAMPAMAQDAGTPPPLPQADGGGPGGHRAEAMARFQEMSDKLALTPEQQDVFKKSMMDERMKMKALRDDTTVEGKARRKQMMQIHADATATRRAVLTDDQKPKYDAMEAEMRQHMRERMHGQGAGGEDAGGPPPPPPSQEQ